MPAVEFVYGDSSTSPLTGSAAGLFRSASVAATLPTTAQVLETYTGTSPGGRRSARSVSFAATGPAGTGGKAEPHAQYEVKPDGTIVRMRCPKCGADKFRSMLGFLNHCRIHCRLVFSSQDDRLQRCGVPINADEVPLDYFTKHPSQLKQEMDLALIRAGVHGPVSDTTKRPMIRVSVGEASTATLMDGEAGGASSPGAGVDGGAGVFPSGITGGGNGVSAPDTTAGLGGSRYYVKRRIIVGNVAKSLLATSLTQTPLASGKKKKPARERESVERPEDQGINNDSSIANPLDAGAVPAAERKDALPTHKWRVYLKASRLDSAGDDFTRDPASFIKGVRFFLHPSYRPNDVVDVLMPGPPGTFTALELTRSGWGEFPIRMQLYFWDSRNRPLEIVHYLRVLTATTGKFVVTAEQAYDIEIDRKTNFSLYTGPPIDGEDKVSLPSLGATSFPTASQHNQVTDYDLLEMVIDDFPLASQAVGRRAEEIGYLPKYASMEAFLQSSISEQRDGEAVRSMAICEYLGKSFPNFGITSEEVTRWCREKGHTPASVASLIAALEQTEAAPGGQLLYCRFCGLAHLPQAKFDVLQKNCSLRPRKIHLSSRTSASELMSQFELLPENSDVVKRLKQEHLGPLYIVPSALIMPEERVSAPIPSAALTDAKEEVSGEAKGNGINEDDPLTAWTRERMQELGLPHLLSSAAGRSVAGTSSSSSLMAVAKLVSACMRSFLGDLIKASAAEIPDSIERTADRPVLLTPLHMYRAITKGVIGCDGTNRHFDFLSNAYMLGGPISTPPVPVLTPTSGTAGGKTSSSPAEEAKRASRLAS